MQRNVVPPEKPARRSIIDGDKVKQLCALGFSFTAARLALQQAKGCPTRAGVWLLDASNACCIQIVEAGIAAAYPVRDGCSARIGGLRGASHLNGTLVTVERFDEEDQRWVVRPPMSEPISIRPRFLERIDAEGAELTALMPPRKSVSNSRDTALGTDVLCAELHDDPAEAVQEITNDLSKQANQWRRWELASEKRLALLQEREMEAQAVQVEWRAHAQAEKSQLSTLEERCAETVDAHDATSSMLFRRIREMEEATRGAELNAEASMELLRQRELKLHQRQAQSRDLAEKLSEEREGLSQKRRACVATRAALRTQTRSEVDGKPTTRPATSAPHFEADLAASASSSSCGSSVASDEAWDVDWSQLPQEAF